MNKAARTPFDPLRGKVWRSQRRLLCCADHRVNQLYRLLTASGATDLGIVANVSPNDDPFLGPEDAPVTSPCGYWGDPLRECSCGPAVVTRYQKRISGPLLDRIDIHEVPRVDYEKLTDDRRGELSAAVRERVERAREVQQRFAGTGLVCNAEMGPTEVRDVCRLDEAGRALVRAAMQQLQMSARAFHRILKLARTIADLAGSGRIEPAHLAEAIQYRPRRG